MVFHRQLSPAEHEDGNENNGSATETRNEDAFVRGYEALLADLRALDRALAEVFDLPQGTTIVFSHPVYQYVERNTIFGRIR